MQPLKRSQSADLSRASLETELSRWAAELRYEDLPAGAVAQLKRLLRDTLAVAWAGTGADGIEPVRALAVSQQGRAESSLWAFGDRLPAPQAAFVNGMTAAALDFDSVHDVATVHADIVVLPAVLALAERNRLSGKEFLAAYAAGDEISVRLAQSVQRHPGWFYTSALGVFAAAAGAGRALGLDPQGVRTAMGVALSRAAGTQQPLMERSLTKRLQSAFAARDGVEAALLAQAGVSAPADFFSGACGFEALYSGLDGARALDGLGRDYRFSSLTFKKYASCFCNHAPIEAALELVRGAGLRAEDVHEARVRISPFMARLVGAPFEPGDDPQVAAQFSVQYSIASALARGRFLAEDIQPAAVADPAVQALARQVRVDIDPAQPGKFAPAVLTVRTRAGAELVATASELPGTPSHPMTESELRAKAMDCLACGARPLPVAAAERLMAAIERVETLADMQDLWVTLQEAGS
jgi:2-methylcitrate dehydratase PrpD